MHLLSHFDDFIFASILTRFVTGVNVKPNIPAIRPNIVIIPDKQEYRAGIRMEVITMIRMGMIRMITCRQFLYCLCTTMDI